MVNSGKTPGKTEVERNKEERESRLAEALRANLRRRKDQARARADGAMGETEAAGDGGE